MQQSQVFLNGTRDYDQLIGQTGPYHGKNIFAAQCLFTGLYAITMVLVLNIYRKLRKVPLLPILILAFASYRVHSIYLLRLFNDPWAMFFLYASVNWCLYNHFSCAAVFFSMAVGVKMNILLFAPGFLLVLLKHRGVYETLGHLAECGIIQVLLGAIFFFRNSEAYFSRAFDFSRQFMYKWTVNWRVIPEALFLDRRFHAALLVLHLLLLSFFLMKFSRSCGGFKTFLQPLPPSQEQKIIAEDVLYPMFVSNFVGIAFSRSLHYQFYVWYYHSIPFILWSVALLSDPMSWNVYPSTVLSSATLHVCHAIILLGLALQPLCNASVPTGRLKGQKIKK
uniref:dolichyl-P-Man:Man5GlcNAc2-PP-dolichol alpha-1,3-mannosyltransferase n=1 Tax=Echinococcus canadensis TaxID=519352 RepID=A0A915EY86_9CEST